MTSRYHDFDAAWAEEDDDPVVIRLLGQEWSCKRPSEVPAGLLLRIDRLIVQYAQMQQTGQIPDDFVMDDSLDPESMLRKLAGDTNVDAWLKAGLSYQRLQAVLRHLQSVYRGQDPGEAQAVTNRAQRRAAKTTKSPSSSGSSSSSGRRSRPTSPASTASKT